VIASTDVAHRHQGHRVMVHEKGDCVRRAEGGEHFRRIEDLVEAKERQHHEPDQHHRPEGMPDERRAVVLQVEQDEEHRQRHRQHHVMQRRCGDLQPFHGREHRDGRRDHAVAVEHGRAQDADAEYDRLASAAGARVAQRERDERHDAALARLSARMMKITYFTAT